MFGLPRAVWLLGWVSLATDAASESIYPLLPFFLTTVLGAGAVSLGIIEGAAEAVNSLLKIVSGRRHVKIAAVEPVGHYAIRIVFDDRHDSGIYSWSYLRELGDSYAEKWAAYQAALLYRGLSRDT